MKLRSISSYIEDRVLGRETALKMIAALLILLAVVTTGPTRIGLIISSITLIIAIRMANIIEDVVYIGNYRVPKQVKGVNRMFQASTDRKLQKIKAEIQNLPRIIQHTRKNISGLEKEARKIRSDRIAGILAKHGDVKEIFTKERRLRTIIDEIKSLKKKENADHYKLDREKSELRLISKYYDKALHGDEGASRQVSTLLAHY